MASLLELTQGQQGALPLDAPAAPVIGAPAAPAAEPSAFRDFALRIGARPRSLLGVLSAAFGQGTEEIAARKRRDLEQQLFERRAEAELTATPERRILEDVAGRKRFLDTGEAVFEGVQAPAQKFTNVTEFAPGKFGGINPATNQFEEIRTQITGDTAKQLDFANKKDKQSFEQTSKLIDSAKKDKRINDFISVSTKFDRIETATPTAAGDISLIFAFMKMLDPESTVREGEFATAAKAGGVPERVVAQYNKVIRGELLTPAIREDFKTQAGAIFNRSKQTADKALRPIEKRAEKRGLDPITVREQIFGIQTSVPTGLQGQPGQEGQTATEDATGRQFVFRNGQWQPQ